MVYMCSVSCVPVTVKSKVGECVGVPNESECDKEDARRVPVWSRGLRRRKSDSCLN